MAANFRSPRRYDLDDAEERGRDGLIAQAPVTQAPATTPPTNPGNLNPDPGRITNPNPQGQAPAVDLAAQARSKFAMGYDLTPEEKAAMGGQAPAATTPADGGSAGSTAGKRPAILDSKYKNIIYGQTYGSGWGQGLNLDEWDGRKLNTAEGKVRDNWATFNVNATQELLRRLFPNATQEQLDDAAYRAFQATANTTKQEGGDRDASKWKPGATFDTVKKFGYGYSEDVLPTDLAAHIARYMPGGITAQQQAALDALEPKFAEQARKLMRNRDKEDDANSGLAGFMNQIGPLGMLAIGALTGGLGWAGSIGSALGATSAVGQAALGSAVIGGVTSAAAGGDILKGAVLGGLGGAVSGYASGLEGGANFMGPVNPSSMVAGLNPAQLAGTLGRAGVGLIGGGDPVATLAGAAVNLGTQAVGNLTGSEILHYAAPVVGGLAKTLIGIDSGSQSNNQRQPPPSNNAATNPPPASTTNPPPAPTNPPPVTTANNQYKPSGVFTVAGGTATGSANTGRPATTQSSGLINRGGASTFNVGLIRRRG